MIEEIYIALIKRESQILKQSVDVCAGEGIVGDRNFGKTKSPGQNITFIEQEEIERFNKNYNQSISLGSTRRNIITSSVRLNDLVGKTFTIGEVDFFGVELCEPCKLLGEILANKSISAKQVVTSFVHRGGLRANILTDGEITIGMELKVKNA